ncbi:glycerol-3-phosphate responsive antiterminator [Fictibacillus aquaticus]|uniref:Glycerol uptake operon antiterminator regulatory protein n=1 Tax=Fictibacillus aquaticus TaxID=2021314 RepID=A0A235F8V6_9BACL|nr:glycerol-3-phosphate responsive antiterminator [Fictibacillus aquaticus]OYD57443.1 glycerol-3-phosphate responsive antiterminator GlpP [Fictibacillus aquaticus]
MSFHGQTVLPAARKMKEFEKLLKLDYEYLVCLDTHISQLKFMLQMARTAEKKVLVHLDLISGLKANEYAVEFLAQEFKPAGIISTRSNCIIKAKKKNMIAIQRLFLLDSIALETSYKIIDRAKPDYLEVLPGIMPEIIREVKEATNTPVIAGGLIRTEENVRMAIEAGAEAVTTSNPALWI